MLKIVYPICCGMDVHKSFFVACIATSNDKGVTSYRRKRFSTFTGDLHRCADWLAEYNCTDVCMESTGKCWIPIYNILEQSCKIVLAYPKYVKAIRGKKTDEKDAQWIADIFKHGLVSGTSAVTTLRRNTGQFLWRRPSSFYSARATSLPPAPLVRLLPYILGYHAVACFRAPFCMWYKSLSCFKLITYISVFCSSFRGVGSSLCDVISVIRCSLEGVVEKRPKTQKRPFSPPTTGEKTVKEFSASSDCGMGRS